jgi:hypothetical protein
MLVCLWYIRGSVKWDRDIRSPPERGGICAPAEVLPELQPDDALPGLARETSSVGVEDFRPGANANPVCSFRTPSVTTRGATPREYPASLHLNEPFREQHHGGMSDLNGAERSEAGPFVVVTEGLVAGGTVEAKIASPRVSRFFFRPIENAETKTATRKFAPHGKRVDIERIAVVSTAPKERIRRQKPDNRNRGLAEESDEKLAGGNSRFDPFAIEGPGPLWDAPASQPALGVFEDRSDDRRIHRRRLSDGQLVVAFVTWHPNA